MNPHFVHSLFCRPWNIEGTFWSSMANAAIQPGALSLADFFTARKPMEIDANGVAHISITGVLGDLAPIDEAFGDSDYGSIVAELMEAKKHARATMLHVDSPGGQATGNVEISRMVPGKKPTAAHVTGMGCSAAYCIAAGADHISAEPSAIIGSIGTILAMLDVSGLWESMGVKPDYIKSGDLKAAGYPPAQTAEERASLQETVDDLFALFKGHVSTYRAVPASAMQGQAFVAARAKENRIIDSVSNYEQAYQKLLKRM